MEDEKAAPDAKPSTDRATRRNQYVLPNAKASVEPQRIYCKEMK